MEFFQKIFLCRSIAWLLLSFAGVASPALAQFRADERLDTKLDRRTIASKGPRAASSKEGLDISLVTSLAYDNNIFQSATDETGSLVAQVEPSIGWTVGERDKAWFRIAYEGAAIWFFSRSEDSRIDNRVVAEGGITKRNVVLAYSARWARLGSPSADIGGQSDRIEYGGQIAATYAPKGKLSYRVFAERSVVDQVEPAFFDFFQSSGGIAAQYRYSPKTEVELAYRLGSAEVDGSGSQTFHRLGLQALWRPRSKLNLSLEGGFEYRNYESGSGFEPYLAARVDWNPRAKTAVYLEAYRRVEASAAVEGENFNLGGFRAGVTQQLRDGWSAGFEIGRETADYFGVTGAAESGREDVITFVRPSLRYALNEDSELVLVYQWSRSDSTDPDFGYDNQQLGVSMNYRF